MVDLSLEAKQFIGWYSQPSLSEAVREIASLKMTKTQTLSDWELAPAYTEEMIQCESNRKYKQYALKQLS